MEKKNNTLKVFTLKLQPGERQSRIDRYNDGIRRQMMLLIRQMILPAEEKIKLISDLWKAEIDKQESIPVRGDEPLF